MKKLLATIFLLQLSFWAKSQLFTVNTGNAIKVPMRQYFLRVVHGDENGCYLLETRHKNINMLYNGEMEQTLYKLNKACNVLFQKDFGKELNKKLIGSIKVLKGELFTFTADAVKKENRYSISVAKLSAKDGEITTPLTEVVSLTYIGKDDEFTYTINPLQDSSGFRILLNQMSEKETKIWIFNVDLKLNKSFSTSITYGLGKEKAALEDVFFNGKDVIVVARNIDVLKEKRKEKSFVKNISFTSYSENGAKKKEVFTEVQGKFITNTQIVQQVGNQFIVAGFYSNEVDNDYTNGLFVNKLDLEKGTTINSTTKEINQAVLGYETAGSKKADRGVEGEIIVKGIVPNPATGGLVMLSESTYKNNFSAGGTVHSDYEMGDILIVDIDKSGKIGWMNNVSKKQDEMFKVDIMSAISFSKSSPYSAYKLVDYPMYSSYSILATDKALSLIFSDNSDNAQITSTTSDVKSIGGSNFKNASVYALSLNYATGKLTRRALNISNDDHILIPKSSFASGNTIYIAKGSELKPFKESEITVSKIVIK